MGPASRALSRLSEPVAEAKLPESVCANPDSRKLWIGKALRKQGGKDPTQWVNPIANPIAICQKVKSLLLAIARVFKRCKEPFHSLAISNC